MKKYKLIALMGQAGAGKDTILNKVVETYKDLHPIVSFTTRPKREGEVDGINYHFISVQEFGDKIVNGDMLEATCFNDWFYGTGVDSLDMDSVNIGVFNPEGIETLIDDGRVDIVVYYVTAKDKTRLIRQLNREEDPNIDEIIRRYKTDYEDFYDFSFHYNEIPNEKEADLDIAAYVVHQGAIALAAKLN